MTVPVPGVAIGTPYGRRGPYWSCDRDAYGNGIHTGCDYPAPVGTKVVAARPGKAVYSNHGSAFGYHQLDILCDDGTRDFYAHMTTRTVADGARVEAGQQVGKVGAEGNVTGPHLHFERHATHTGGWSCSVVRDPAPSINYKGGKDDDDMPLSDDDIKKIASRINHVLGDYNSAGKTDNPDTAKLHDQRLRQIENVVRDIQSRVKAIENAVKS